MTWLGLDGRGLDNVALEAGDLAFAFFPIADCKGHQTTGHRPNVACCLIL